MSQTSYPGQASAPLKHQIGEHSAKLQNDLTPELRDKQKRQWKGSELMSEEQARRLHEVSLKKAKKKTRQLGQPASRPTGGPSRTP
jgi:hypothetical protein